MTDSIRLGALEWAQPAWVGPFYPADMPEDWRLAYYSTQFNCVFLEASRWLALDDVVWASWCDEVHSQFVFLLEAKEGVPMAMPTAAQVVILPRDDGRLIWFDARSDLKALTAEITRKQAVPELYLISRDGNLAQVDRVRTLLELLGY